MFWETTSISASGSETMFFDDASGIWTSQAGMDGVYAFSYDGGCSITFPSIDYDCSNLGENSVNVAVVDNAGNETVCSATVIVSDVTAPLLVCGPDALLYDGGTVSDAPGLTIDTNSTDVIISSIINITEDFAVSDINVALNVTHTYIGDMNITLTSPDGTTVLLFDGLCDSTHDLNLVFDDEGLDDEGISCGDLQSGQHLDIAAILGYDPLSTFDGENLMGDWTLTIEDTWPGLDGGMLNSWGIEYEYSYPNPAEELFIELDENGHHTITLDDLTDVASDACGISAQIITVTDVDCSDIGDPVSVMTMVTDLSGNVSHCTQDVYVVDTTPPVITCPGNYTVQTNAEGVYYIPDYIALEEANAIDNCTEVADIVFVQTPEPGIAYGITEGTINPPVEIVFTATDAYGNQDICQFELEICGCSCGTPENKNDIANQFVISPNPARSKVSITNTSNMDIDSITFFDLQGKRVLKEARGCKAESQKGINISNLQAGFYLVKLKSSNQTITKKLIIE